SHQYKGAGTLTVKVTVTDGVNPPASASATVTVADAPPVAALTVTPSSGSAPLSVAADASGSTDPDTTPITNYTFDFADGPVIGPQSGATATHTYKGAGTYTVKVTVRDAANLTSTATTTVTVADAAPVAALTVIPSSGTAPLGVTADASGSSDPDTTPITTYTFDFGDATTPLNQTTPTLSHQYAGAGTYTVKVTVTDGVNPPASKTATVTVADAPPVAALTVTPSSGTAPLTVTADASGSTDPDATPITSYTFDFGDGIIVGPQAAKTAGHQYRGAKAYTVKVTVTDGINPPASATATVTVADAAPVAALSVTPSAGTAPLMVTADASGSTDPDTTPITGYTFDFGDTSPSVTQGTATTTHQYKGADAFTVKVTVTDGVNPPASTTATVTVADAPPVAALTVTPSSGTAPLGVTVDASGSSDPDGTIATYAFDFGEGTPVTQTTATATHLYRAAKTYTVRVTVTDSGGLSASRSDTVTVATAPPVTPLSL